MPNITHNYGPALSTNSDFYSSWHYIVFTVIEPNPFSMIIYFDIGARGLIGLTREYYIFQQELEVEFTPESRLNVEFGQDAVLSIEVIESITG